MHSNIQAEILTAVLKGVYTDKEVLRHVEEGFFSVGAYQWVVRTLKKRQWEPFSWEYADPLLTTDLKDDTDKIDVYRNQIFHLFKRELTFSDDAIRDFVQFVSVSKAKAAIKDAYDSYEKSNRADYFFHSLKKDLVSAENIINGDKIDVRDYAAGFKDRMKERKDTRDNPDTNPVIKMGFRGIDDYYEVRGSQIINFLAPMKAYKSILLNDIAAVGLLQGFNVAQVVFENTSELTENRYDAFINRINYNRLKSAALTPSEMKEIEDRMAWVDSWSNRLKIIKMISKKNTVHDIEDQLARLEDTTGFIPEMLVIDYLNIVAPTDRSIREENLRQGQVLWDMKETVDKRGIPIFTASQTNQEGNKAIRGKKESKDPLAPKASVDSTHQGKAIDISQGVDLSISINQTPSEKEENIIRLNPFLVRDGEIPGGEICLNCDIEKMMVSIDTDYLWDIARQVHKF